MRGNDRRSIVIQKRDRHLLTELTIMRVIDRDQAKVVAGFGSTSRTNTRLLALTRAGLLRRFFLGVIAGSRKALYALSTKGAALVGVTPRGPRRTNNGVVVADFFVLHQLAINQLYCALKYGPLIPGISFGRWLAFHAPLSPSIRLIPDGYFEINSHAATVAAFLEVDLGHERLTVWRGKIKHYLQLALSGDFERLFATHQFRVLVIANSDRRLLSIRKVVQSSTQKLFWFTTTDAIQTNGFFAPIWLRPNGDERRSLLSNAVSLT